MSVSLPRPTPEYIQDCLAEIDAESRIAEAERAVSLVFGQWPRNHNYDEVLVKVMVLDRAYSTNIFDPYTVANHIMNIAPDDDLHAGRATVVDRIANITFSSGKSHRLYSFATKFCAWQNSEGFQIYDSYVDRTLRQYRSQFKFARFKNDDLRQYGRFLEVIAECRTFFGLEEFSRKQVDKFLWGEGRRQVNTTIPTDTEFTDG